MGRVIPPGLVAEDCVIPAKANAAMGTRFPYLLKGIEPSRFEAVRAGLPGRGRPILVFNKTVKNRFIRLLFQQPAA